MERNLLEIEKVWYNAAAIKTHLFEIAPHSMCFRRHWHDRIELLRVMRGSMRVICGNDSYVAREGDVVIFPPKQLHEGNTADESVEYRVMMFDVRYFYNETETCKRLLPAIFDGRAVFRTVTSDAKTVLCYDRIFESSETDSLDTVAGVYTLLFLLCRNSMTELHTAPKDLAVKRIIDYIEENAKEDITVDLLAEKFAYSKAYLCRKFKDVTGLSPMLYLKIYRLEAACKKIVNRETNISNIAKELGFSDANYFTRCFKAHFGVSPSQYGKLQ
jgi:AraC-like DNA-binding protein